jgi:hypothetical protein
MSEGGILSFEPLQMAEAYALQRALEDLDFRNGLTQFLAEQAHEATQQCCKAMGNVPPQTEKAIGFAACKVAAEETFNRLEAFVKEQMTKR